MRKPSIHRSKVREVVLQLLYQRDQNSSPMSEKAAQRFTKDRLVNDQDDISFANELSLGVESERKQIDALLSATADNWRLHRMNPVDRNILRIAVYEMKFAKEPVPATVAINEALELAHRFGTEETPAFINGILDKISK